MSLEFEVTDTDLGGRVGRLRVNGRTVQTPSLVPVVHPVRQLIPPSTPKEMGFEGVMTNSFIIYRRLRQEGASKGVHSLVDFDGVVMTDSGGYQVLEYGSVGVDHLEIAKFQASIGSDL